MESLALFLPILRKKETEINKNDMLRLDDLIVDRKIKKRCIARNGVGKFPEEGRVMFHQHALSEGGIRGDRIAELFQRDEIHRESATGFSIRGFCRLVHCREFVEMVLLWADKRNQQRIRSAISVLANDPRVPSFEHHGRRTLRGERKTVIFGVHLYFYLNSIDQSVDLFSITALDDEGPDDGGEIRAPTFTVMAPMRDWVNGVANQVAAAGLWRLIRFASARLFFGASDELGSTARRYDIELSDYRVFILGANVDCSDLRSFLLIIRGEDENQENCKIVNPLDPLTLKHDGRSRKDGDFGNTVPTLDGIALSPTILTLTFNSEYGWTISTAHASRKLIGPADMVNWLTVLPRHRQHQPAVRLTVRVAIVRRLSS